MEQASWWNGHLGGTGILPVPFPGGLSPQWEPRKSGLPLGWCVTGRAVPTLALGVEHDGKPALTHPTQVLPFASCLLPMPLRVALYFLLQSIKD
ncbi:hypothetical protein BJP34_28230 [Moorena producens PAL-8-15-08-1]|uniref:Uncharacterized protein n=1 Tax=Moorena producens PAL-8-15-08-1 TaxID=1458985 RepID=A0A1D8TYS8_9CYAN|nr:hypothetical protein BJP34_28230 [Moorena producens PAL-8-15-08-1]